MGDENKKYVPEGVYLVCDKGSVPPQLMCDPQEINIYGVRFADVNDNKPLINIPSFGVCKIKGTCEPPPGLTWTKFKTDVTLHGFHPLLEDSECVCPVGGLIKIFFDKYAAEVAAENNSESDFVSEPLSSSILGMALLGPGTGQLMALFAPNFTEGVGRGFKKGAEGTWNLLKDIWNKPGETLGGMAKGLGNLAVIGGVYAANATNPMGTFQSDMQLRTLDAKFGTDFTGTRDALVTGVGGAVEHSWENVKRGNWGEVGEDVGQIQYAVVEAVVGSKGAGLVLKGAKTGAQVGLNVAKGLIGAQRLAQIAGKTTQVLNRIKFAASGIVRTAKRIEFEPNTLGTTGGNIRLRPIEEIPMARRNARLAGSTHPRTGVPFDERGYPIFESTHDVNLPNRLIGHQISDNTQMRHATENLRDHLNRNPNLRRNYTERQLQQIDNGEPNIDGYTWHHHQDGVKLQLVDRETHRLTGHDGGRRNTGGRR